jgi:hypothetical protein
MVSVPGPLWAQSVGKVVQRHLEARGGVKAVEKIVSTDVRGSVSAADGRSGAFVQSSRRPNLFYVSMSWGDSRWSAGFNGRAAWQNDGVEGARTLYGEAASRVRAEASYAVAQYTVSEKTSQIALAERDQVRGRPVFVLVTVTPDGISRKLFLDTESYLLVKDEQTTDGGVEERFFDDYRPVDQVLEPHRIEWHRNGETFAIAVERITHNAVGDEGVFDIPMLPDEPHVDVDGVLSTAALNEQRVANLLTSYTYTMSNTFATIDRDGRTRRRELASFEVFHLGGGQPVTRVVRRNGEPVAEAERRREDARVQNLVREYERQRLSERTGGGPRQERGPSLSVRNLWGSLVAEMPLLTSDWLAAYLRMSDFRQVRHEQVRGRPVIVVEFQPRRGVAPNRPFERQAGTMAGTVWIDDALGQVMRIESYFLEGYEEVHPGSSMRMERTLVDGEVWLPSRSELNVRRNLPPFAVSQPLAFGTELVDHRKFSVETDFELTLPAAAR